VLRFETSLSVSRFMHYALRPALVDARSYHMINAEREAAQKERDMSCSGPSKSNEGSANSSCTQKERRDGTILRGQLGAKSCP
jgi:hypothetical protein